MAEALVLEKETKMFDVMNCKSEEERMQLPLAPLEMDYIIIDCVGQLIY